MYLFDVPKAVYDELSKRVSVEKIEKGSAHFTINGEMAICVFEKKRHKRVLRICFGYLDLTKPKTFPSKTLLLLTSRFIWNPETKNSTERIGVIFSDVLSPLDPAGIGAGIVPHVLSIIVKMCKSCEQPRLLSRKEISELP